MTTSTPLWHRLSASVMRRLSSWLQPKQPSRRAISAKPAIQLPGYSGNWTHLSHRSSDHAGYWLKRANTAGAHVLFVHDPAMQLTWYCQFLNPHDRRRYIDQLAGRTSVGPANAIIVRLHANPVI